MRQNAGLMKQRASPKEQMIFLFFRYVSQNVSNCLTALANAAHAKTLRRKERPRKSRNHWYTVLQVEAKDVCVQGYRNGRNWQIAIEVFIQKQPEHRAVPPLPLFDSGIEKPALRRTRQQALSNPLPVRMERTGLDHLASLFGSCSLLL